jgi:hypothetical protein
MSLRLRTVLYLMRSSSSRMPSMTLFAGEFFLRRVQMGL